MTVALIRGSASFMYGCVLTSCVMSKGSQRDAMCVIDNSVIAKNKKGIQIIRLKLHVKQDVFVCVRL